MGILTIPPEGTYTDIERSWIENEPPGLLPVDQGSVWGQVRKTFSDYLQELADELAEWWVDLDPRTVDLDDVPFWEYELGVASDDSKTIEARRSFIAARRERGAFTRTRRRNIVETFIVATFGQALQFDSSGLPFSAGGMEFYSGVFNLVGAYNIVEDIPNFFYAVRVDDLIDIDAIGLNRELLRITPAGIDFTIDFVHDPFMDPGTPLTLSGNEITDAMRQTGIRGDGLFAPSGIGVYEATTNLCTNGGFETGLNQGAGWYDRGSGSTVTQDTVGAKFGTKSLKAIHGAGTPTASTGTSVTVVAAQLVTCSMWLSGSGTAFVFANERTGADANVSDHSSNTVTLSATPQRVIVTYTPGAGNTKCRVGATGSAGGTIYIDGVQIEQKPIATPYVETDNATATRSAAHVQVPSPLINASQAWVAFRLWMPWANGTSINGGVSSPRLMHLSIDANNNILVFVSNADYKTISVRRTSAGIAGTDSSQTGAWGADSMITVVVAWDSGHSKLSLNGANFTQHSDTPPVGAMPAYLDLLSLGGTGAFLDADVLWFACGVGILTDGDAAKLAGLTMPEFIDFPDEAQLTAIMPMVDSTVYVPL